MLGVPEVVPPEPRNRGGRQDRDDHVSSATPRSRLPRETRFAICGRGARRSPAPRLRSSPGACHRPVHDHPLRHQARRPRTQPVLPRVVAGRATRRISRPHRLAGLQETQPGRFRGRARHRRLALLHDSRCQQTADPRDRNQLRSPDPPIRLSRHRPTRFCSELAVGARSPGAAGHRPRHRPGQARQHPGRPWERFRSDRRASGSRPTSPGIDPIARTTWNPRSPNSSHTARQAMENR